MQLNINDSGPEGLAVRSDGCHGFFMLPGKKTEIRVMNGWLKRSWDSKILWEWTVHFPGFELRCVPVRDNVEPDRLIWTPS